MNRYIIIDTEEHMTWLDWLVCVCIAVPALVMIWVVVVLVMSL